jgi:hypothetical protein
MPGTLFKRFCERVALFGDGRVFVRDLAGTTWDVTAEWQALRDEIEAERCENCDQFDRLAWSRAGIPADGRSWCCVFERVVVCDFSCSHFTKKQGA